MHEQIACVRACVRVCCLRLLHTSARVVARLVVVMCHQLSGFSLISSTIHHPITPSPSMGAIKLKGVGGASQGGNNELEIAALL